MVGKNFFGEVLVQSECGAKREELQCSGYTEKPNSHGRCVFRGHEDACLHPEAKKMQSQIAEIIKEMFPDT